jgi:probable HAF family extracellular repeat protein
MPRALLSAVLSLSVLFSTLVAAQDASYTFETIDVPGARVTQALGINETGQIVGHFYDAIEGHGFLKNGTTFTTIDVPGAPGTWALGINETGQIVGYFHSGVPETPHGFVTDGTTFTTIDAPGAMFTDQRVRQQFHAKMSLLNMFKTQEEALELVLPRKCPIHLSS